MFTNTKESLCNSHDTIMYWIRDVKKQLKKMVKEKPELENFVLGIKDTLNTTLEETRRAKKKGQRMENRLSKYRRAIEGLGFKRI